MPNLIYDKKLNLFPVNMNPDAGIQWRGWAIDGPLLPGEVHARNLRFQKYHQLYSGNVDTLSTLRDVQNTQAPVHMNWYRQTAHRYADLVMGPPENEDVSLRQQQYWSLAYHAVVSLQVYGVAIIAPNVMTGYPVAIHPWHYWRWDSAQQWLLPLSQDIWVAHTWWGTDVFYWQILTTARRQDLKQDLPLDPVENGLKITYISDVQEYLLPRNFRDQYGHSFLTVLTAMSNIVSRQGNQDVGSSIIDDMYPLVMELTRRSSLDSMGSEPALKPLAAYSAT